jgi:hypothetical protein
VFHAAKKCYSFLKYASNFSGVAAAIVIMVLLVLLVSCSALLIWQNRYVVLHCNVCLYATRYAGIGRNGAKCRVLNEGDGYASKNGPI